MSDSVRDLADLLAREREAVLAADLERLTDLQDEKRTVLDRAIAEGAVDDATFQHLAEVARANIVLIRQLVTIHRALAGLEPASYGADGRAAHGMPPPHARGVL